MMEGDILTKSGSASEPLTRISRRPVWDRPILAKEPQPTCRRFPNKNVLSPRVDDIILLYQKVNGDPAYTHLVTLVDGESIDTDDVKFPYARKVKVIVMTGNS